MLKNKTPNDVMVRWNGLDKKAKAGQNFDARYHFSCQEKEVPGVEGFLVSKYPDVFEIVKVEPAPKDQDPAAPPAAAGAGAPAGDPPAPVKEPADLTKDELRNELVEAGITEGWDGDSKKADLVELVKKLRIDKHEAAKAALGAGE